MSHKGIASSRQTIAAKQRVAPYSRTHTKATPADYIPQEVLNATFVLNRTEAAKGPVQLRRAVRPFQVGTLYIPEGSPFWFVQSKFGEGRRFYALIENPRENESEPESFQCSSTEERTVKMCTRAVLATRRMVDFVA